MSKSREICFCDACRAIGINPYKTLKIRVKAIAYLMGVQADTVHKWYQRNKGPIQIHYDAVGKFAYLDDVKKVFQFE